jgi:hypothetical protein
MVHGTKVEMSASIRIGLFVLSKDVLINFSLLFSLNDHLLQVTDLFSHADSKSSSTISESEVPELANDWRSLVMELSSEFDSDRGKSFNCNLAYFTDLRC